MIDAVQQALWLTLPYKVIEPRSWDLPAVFGNCDKAKQLLWRSTKRSVTEGIQDMWKFRKR
jgi:UDP-glucose 4-epimerase